MEWRNAGYRIKIGPVDGTVLGPLGLCAIFFHIVTTIFLALYILVNVYITSKGRTMSWVLKRMRSILRRGVVLARPSAYWRWMNR